MKAMADRISIISAERVRDELTWLLLSPAPRRGLDLMVATGLAQRVLPEPPALRLSGTSITGTRTSTSTA